jgi:hypothetical protein
LYSTHQRGSAYVISLTEREEPMQSRMYEGLRPRVRGPGKRVNGMEGDVRVLRQRRLLRCLDPASLLRESEKIGPIVIVLQRCFHL